MDIIVSATGIAVFSPVLVVVMFLIWKQDRHSPFFIASRVGKGEQLFRMVKLRSMIVGAEKWCDSASAADSHHPSAASSEGSS
jgi:lipopolysaccharide/colanic/teichoic acid biosynthesis glycosyltransferase